MEYAAVIAQLRALAPAARGMTADSRRVSPGDVFLAYPGDIHDGRRHIAAAIHAGAAAVLWEPAAHAWNGGDVANLPVANLKEQAAGLAAAWHGNPSRQLWVTGITGTNGKTSVSHWLSAAWTALGRRTAAIGTIGNGFPDALEVASHTTPDAVSLQALLAGYRDAGAQGVAMEVSSHGLHQGRVAEVAFDVAVLTNLTQDHLDYHGDMASYAAAKARLFAWPGLKWAVLNADDELGASLEKQLRGGATRVVSYGLHGGDLQAQRLSANHDGLRMEIVSPWGMGELVSPLLGEFNAYNLLAALGALLAGGVKLDDALAALARVEAVPGRMQRVGGPLAGRMNAGEPTVIVDFAHTPDALEKVLATLKPLTRGRLICVFGCGGGRDSGKRPVMGAVVAERADQAIVTSDNPRHEDPAHIIADILAGMPPGQDAIVDRRAAIRAAIHAAGPEDIVVLAGKGHEPYQEIDGIKTPFSDCEEARQALSSRSPGRPKNDLAPLGGGSGAFPGPGQYLIQGNNVRLHEAAQAIGAGAIGADVALGIVSSDTRDLPPGCLFVALKGPRFDGHAFAAQALENGAAAVMVAADAGLDVAPALLVEDTRLGLGRLAAWHRSRMPAKVAAITGSNGKTTVKEMLAAICAAAAGENAVLATAGNLNNDIGMPLTLLRLTPEHRYAAIEMGMNHSGEIAYLTELARPDVALVNNALRAHLEGLGSVEAIARAKGEIYAGLKDDGIAIVNADDPHAEYWRGLAGGHKVLSFGRAEGADVCIRGARDGNGVVLDTPLGRIETSLQVPGEHNLRNAAAATAAALALGIPPDAVARGLADYGGSKGRLQAHACILGATLIDDTYNANPDSVAAAIEVLAARPGQRILVLGDMGELGPDAAALHREVGERAAKAGIDRLLCLGDLSVNAARGFGQGLANNAAMHFERIEELLAEIECALNVDVTVLVKGSRFMKMERVVQSFMEGVDSPHASLPDEAPTLRYPEGAHCPPQGGLSEDKQCS